MLKLLLPALIFLTQDVSVSTNDLNLGTIDNISYAHGGTQKSVNNVDSITTVVQDPNNPEEPWIVTTYQRHGEAIAGVIRRHALMVAAVREVLRV